MSDYEQLEVFQKSHSLVLSIYDLTTTFPKDEKFRLVDQMIRSAYSIPSNIVEGNSKNTTKDYLNFLYMSRGSLHELKYFLLLSKDLNYISEQLYLQFSTECDKIAKMLNGLINSLKRKMDSKNAK